jgi:hypothetical protein
MTCTLGPEFMGRIQLVRAAWFGRCRHQQFFRNVNIKGSLVLVPLHHLLSSGLIPPVAHCLTNQARGIPAA